MYSRSPNYHPRVLISNRLADDTLAAARRRAEKGGKLTERWSSLAYIKRNMYEIRSKNLSRWYETETRNREATRRGYITMSCGQKKALI